MGPRHRVLGAPRGLGTGGVSSAPGTSSVTSTRRHLPEGRGAEHREFLRQPEIQRQVAHAVRGDDAIEHDGRGASAQARRAYDDAEAPGAESADDQFPRCLVVEAGLPGVAGPVLVAYRGPEEGAGPVGQIRDPKP